MWRRNILNVEEGYIECGGENIECGGGILNVEERYIECGGGINHALLFFTSHYYNMHSSVLDVEEG